MGTGGPLVFKEKKKIFSFRNKGIFKKITQLT